MTDEGDEKQVTGSVFDQLREEAASSDAESWRPDLPNKVFSHSKRKGLVTEDLLAGVARLGGPVRVPKFHEAYLLAAESLLNQALKSEMLDEYAVVILYCVRHATELALKDLINECLIRRTSLSGVIDGVERPTYSDHWNVKTHKLVDLTEQLERQLVELFKAEKKAKTGREHPIKPPEQLRALAVRLQELDQDGERFRFPAFIDTEAQKRDADDYSDIFEANENQFGEKFQVTRSHVKISATFPTSQVFPVQEFVHSLRAAFDEVFVYAGSDLDQVWEGYFHGLDRLCSERDHAAYADWEWQRRRQAGKLKEFDVLIEKLKRGEAPQSEEIELLIEVRDQVQEDTNP